MMMGFCEGQVGCERFSDVEKGIVKAVFKPLLLLELRDGSWGETLEEAKEQLRSVGSDSLGGLWPG